MLIDKLISLLKDKKLTQKQVANDLGLSQQRFSLYVLGKREPDTNTLKQLASYFNVSLDYLLTGEENTNHTVLTTDEQELLDGYNKLDSRGQHKLHTVIYEELERIEGSNI